MNDSRQFSEPGTSLGKFSTRIPALEESAWARAVTHARPDFDLTVSNPTVAGFREGERLFGCLAEVDASVYEPSPLGIASARQALVDAFYPELSREDIVLTSSTSEAYAFLLKVFCDAGDTVLIARPSYPLFEHLLRLECVVPEYYDAHFLSDGWWVDEGELASKAQATNAKLIFTVSPNNPTGHFVRPFSSDDTCHEAFPPVVIDEVFAPYPLDGEPPREAWRTPTIRLGGLSKALGLPQLKLSWMALHGPEAFVETLRDRLSFVADAYLSLSTAVQLALPALLKQGRARQAEIHARLRTNLARLRAERRASDAFDILPVEAGWYVVLRLPSLMSTDDWCRSFLREGVLVQPGWLYDLPGCHVVLSLLTPPAIFAEGVARVMGVIRKNA